MSKYATLIAQIAANIRRNGAQAITGDLLQEQLLAMITSLGEYYQFDGLALPSTEFTPGYEPVVFIAATPGTYTNFGGLVVADSEVALLVWDGSAWSKQTTDIATRTEVSQLGQKVGDLSDLQTTDKSSIVAAINEAAQTTHTTLGLSAFDKQIHNWPRYSDGAIGGEYAPGEIYTLINRGYKSIKVNVGNIDTAPYAIGFYTGTMISPATYIQASSVQFVVGTTEYEAEIPSEAQLIVVYNSVEVVSSPEISVDAGSATPEDLLQFDGIERPVQLLDDANGRVYLPASNSFWAPPDGSFALYKVNIEGATRLRVQSYAYDSSGTISFYSSDSVFNADTLVGWQLVPVGYVDVSLSVPSGAICACFSLYGPNNRVAKAFAFWRQSIEEERDLAIVEGGAVYYAPENVLNFGNWNQPIFKAIVSNLKKIRIQSNAYDALSTITFFSSASTFTLDTMISYESAPAGIFDMIVDVPSGAECVCFVWYRSNYSPKAWEFYNREIDRIPGQVQKNAEDIEYLKDHSSSMPALRLPRLDVISDTLVVNGNDISPLTTQKNKVNVSFIFTGLGIYFEDTGTIAYQGQSSLADAKKGFSCTFSKKHKFKDWLPFDEYHLKGYMNDWMHVRDTVSNRIYEQILRSRLVNIRPFTKYNDFSFNDVDMATNSNRLCHTDDFKCEMYINGNYWGLYSFRLKKDRANYKLTKNNASHVQLDPATLFLLTSSTFPWTSVEVRNPKISTDKAGLPYDGDNPTEIPDGTTHDIITTFYAGLRGVTSSTTKTQLAAFIDLEEFIDYWLLTDFCCNGDAFARNTLWTTWDGVHWSPIPYDLNCGFGAIATDAVYETSEWPANTNILTVSTATRWASWLTTVLGILSDDINARYAALRKAIFTAENVIELHTSINLEVGGDVYKDDVARWHEPGAGYNTDDYVRDIQKTYQFMVGRLAYLDTKYSYNP